jgi:hypothetical protein
MSGVKAKLKVVLQADETIVAESEDPALWQRVLLAINGSSVASFAGTGAVGASAAAAEAIEQQHPLAIDDTIGGESQEVQKFARALGIAASVVEGACAPAKKSPFLTLDMHCWDAMKEQTPGRGSGGTTPMGVAGTLLALWMQSAKLGTATQAEVQKVLGTISIRDNNPMRSIKASEWLQARPGGVIVLNPARAKRAFAIAKAFCTKDWRSDHTWKRQSAE